MPEREDFALRAVHDWAATLDLEASPDELGALIRMSRIAALQQRVDNRALRQFESHGIRGGADFRTLAYLRRSPTGRTNSELMQALGGSKAGVSARLDRLNSHGITERVPSPFDRRSHTNRLTEHGTEIADSVVTEVVAARRALLADLSSDQISSLAATLGQIIETIQPGD